MSTKSSNLITILKQLLDGEAVTSIDRLASNSNQYFRTIKLNGIELVGVWKPNLTNSGQHKERRLHQTIDNIKRAEAYLRSLHGVKNNEVGNIA